MANLIPPKRVLLFLPVLVLGILLIVFLKSFDFGPRSVLPSALIGKPFPEFQLPALRRQGDVELNDLIGDGNRKLVNVWGTWCLACELEHQLLLDVASSGVGIIGLNYKDDPVKARQWLAQRGDPYQFSIVDLDGQLGIELGVYGAPSTFVVDGQGVILAKHVGQLTQPAWEQLQHEYFED